MDADMLLDLERGLPVTPADRAALRRLREQTPCWLDWDWRIVDKLLPPEALANRPTASDAWQPFSLT